MRITIAQINYHIGNFEGNLSRMKSAIDEAKIHQSDMVCFGELSVCGYPPRDFLEFDDFIDLCEESIKTLCTWSQDIAIVVGSPTRNPDPNGKNLFNSVLFIYGGVVQFVQHKTLLPNYDIFDEYRYFEPAKSWQTHTYKGINFAFTVCEDIWDVHTDDPLYTTVPLDNMIEQNPDFIINISASPFSYVQAEKRRNIVKANVHRYNRPMVYVNHAGAQTELIFDGGSMVVAADGTIVHESVFFKEELYTFDLSEIKNGAVENKNETEKTQLIHDALVIGIKEYFRKLNLKTAVLGLSGGIDSAITAVLSARALGPENVRCLLMPSQYSSEHSVNDARKLAENLGVKYDIIPIASIYNAFLGELEPLFDGLPFNVTEENIQARIRGTLNMAISNKFGNILLNTSNKSELAVGYGTLYGDLAGGLAVLGDVYKTQIYELATYINKDVEVIPINTIQKPPSAELRPGQKDSDSLPEYSILDEILFQYIEKLKGPQDLIEMGFDPALVARILKMVNTNEFKRYQTPPILRVSPKAFGMGRRMPIVGKYLS
ncbi:MAG: NAD+ synthase [Saprospiraceae bacterium]